MAIRDPQGYQYVFTVCEEMYKRQGYVSWSDVARQLNISRQAVLQRLQQGVRHGLISEAEVERWRSTSSRLKASQSRRETSRLLESLEMRFTLTPVNKAWLSAEAQHRGVRPADILNGLINLARESTPTSNS